MAPASNWAASSAVMGPPWCIRVPAEDRVGCKWSDEAQNEWRQCYYCCTGITFAGIRELVVVVRVFVDQVPLGLHHMSHVTCHNKVSDLHMSPHKLCDGGREAEAV